MAIKPLTPGNIKADRATGSFTDKWFYDGLEEFLKALQDYFQANGGAGSVNESDDSITIDPNIDCVKCKLELYYHYNPHHVHIAGYMNAIWIKVKNVNSIDVWIRVGFNLHGRKKVNIYCECDLKCKIYTLVYTPAFALPPNFTNPGVWIERTRVTDISWKDVILEICRRLPCACLASC